MILSGFTNHYWCYFFFFSSFSFCLDFSLSSSAGANSLLFHFVLHVIYILPFPSQAPCSNCCPLHLPGVCGYFLLYAHNWDLELKNIDEREHVALALLCLSCLTQYTFWRYIHFPFFADEQCSYVLHFLLSIYLLDDTQVVFTSLLFDQEGYEHCWTTGCPVIQSYSKEQYSLVIVVYFSRLLLTQMICARSDLIASFL